MDQAVAGRCTPLGGKPGRDGRRRKAGRVLAEALEDRRLLASVYVDASLASGSHDGSSWANAFQDLQQALSAATTGDRVLVAGGTYKPTSGTDRTISFVLKNGVEIDGGYAGDANPSDPDARGLGAYPTILSGDIGVSGNNSDNSYHVVVASRTDATAILDGFTITGGVANGPGQYFNGAGMYNSSASPTIRNCTFTDNRAPLLESGGGAGMYNLSASPTLANCAFARNVSNHFGGGLYNVNGSSPTLTQCSFDHNSSAFGGAGICDEYDSSPTLSDCVFTANTTGSAGGCLYNYFQSSPKLTNCTFTGNTAFYGGGVCNDFYCSPTLTNCGFNGNSADDRGGALSNSNRSAPTLVNCALAGNLARNFGGGIYNYDSSPTLINCTLAANTTTAGFGSGAIYDYSRAYSSSPTLGNCIVWASGGLPIYNDNSGGLAGSPIITFSDIQGGYAGTGNLSADPLFARNPSPGADGQWGTADDDYGDLRLQSGSPCVNAGSNAAVPSGVTTDLAGGLRIQGGIVDIGAHETPAPLPNFTGDYLGVVPTQVLARGTLGVLRNYAVSGAPGSYFFIQYRLSTDQLWGNADDVPIAEYDSIGPGGSSLGPHSGISNLTVPAQARPGTYYLLAKLDSTNVVAETNENDNIIVGNQVQVMAMANDSFSYPLLLGGGGTANASATGTNVGATKEAGEPWHAGYAGGHSVWWTWTAPDSGMAVVDTSGSNFKTLIGVYNGTSVSSLIYTASNKDLGSSVSFKTVRGRQYRIAIDGYQGATGSIKLSLQFSAGQMDDRQAVLTPAASWHEMNGSLLGKMQFAPAGKGEATATWTFSNITPGVYQVTATWLATSNAASNAPFSIYDGNILLGTVKVNQKLTPSGVNSGVVWQSLGSFTISSGNLIIRLSNNADGYVLADGVRIFGRVSE